jgi:hypothetical protein
MVEINAFICGCGHTGTTILARILGAHPEVFCPPFETEVFLTDERKALRHYRALLLVADRLRKRAFVEKTPNHLLRLELIRTLVSGVKFIITVRDGRDVAASFIKRTGNADVGIRRWLDETELSLRERQRPDVLLVKYEDFVAAPKTIIEQVCSFIGVRFHPSILEYHQHPVMWFGEREIRKGTGLNGHEHNALRNWQVNQPIFDGRNLWKGRLSHEQIAVFESGPGEALMRALGYL